MDSRGGRRWWPGVIAPLLLSLVRCTVAPLNGVTPLAPFPTAPPAEPTAAATAQSSVTLTVINHSTEVICAVYFAPTGAALGENRLENEIIQPGDVRSFDLAPGVYDLRADDCFGMVLAERSGAAVFAPAEWEIVPPEP